VFRRNGLVESLGRVGCADCAAAGGVEVFWVEREGKRMAHRKSRQARAGRTKRKTMRMWMTGPAYVNDDLCRTFFVEYKILWARRSTVNRFCLVLSCV